MSEEVGVISCPVEQLSYVWGWGVWSGWEVWEPTPNPSLEGKGGEIEGDKVWI
ncbi:MAG: hypothetical protein SWX82_13410 [Cyanobacteriota bacterium]|nr:hypothetical protein [Cyanobacteriota bacterium]